MPINSNKPNLILIHGWACDSNIWKDFIPLLEEIFVVKTFNLPGYDATPLENNFNYDMDSVSNALHKQISDIEKPFVLGWSLGGLVAMHYACKYQNQISGLITLASTPCFMKKANWPGIPVADFEKLQNNLLTDVKKTIKKFLLWQVHQHKNYQHLLQHIHQLSDGAFIPSTKTLLDSLLLLENDIRDAVQKLPCKQLHILGEIDPIVCNGWDKKLFTNLDKSKITFKTLPTAGHLPFITNATQTFEAIKEFVEPLCKQ